MFDRMLKGPHKTPPVFKLMVKVGKDPENLACSKWGDEFDSDWVAYYTEKNFVVTKDLPDMLIYDKNTTQFVDRFADAPVVGDLVMLRLSKATTYKDGTEVEAGSQACVA